MQYQPQWAARPPDIDYGEAMSSIFRAQDGWKTILIGGVLMLGFPLLLIPPMFAFGWAIDYGRAVARGDHRLPPFQGKHFWDGLRLGLILSVYYLPIILILAPFLIAGIMAGPEPEAGIFPVIAVLPNVLAQLYGLGVSALTPAIYSVYIVEGTFESGFSPRKLGYIMRTRGWTYVGVAAIAYAINAISGLGFILCLVGIFFTVFYAFVVNFNLAGQLARPIVMSLQNQQPSQPQPPPPPSPAGQQFPPPPPASQGGQDLIP